MNREKPHYRIEDGDAFGTDWGKARLLKVRRGKYGALAVFEVTELKSTISARYLVVRGSNLSLPTDVVWDHEINAKNVWGYESKEDALSAFESDLKSNNGVKQSWCAFHPIDPGDKT